MQIVEETVARVDYGVNRAGSRQLRRIWAPEGDTRAVALIVHGIAEHSGRYQRVGAAFAAAGIGAVAIDQRGHGRTEGPRNHVEGFDHFLDDVEDQLAVCRSEGAPVILLGHSMGGLISTAYCLSDRPQPDLLVLSGPALGAGVPGWQQTIVHKLAQLAPKLVLAPPFDTSVLSRDPSVGEEYRGDPLIRPGGSTQLLSQLFATAAETTNRIGDLAVPTLCLHGGDDTLVPTEASEILEGLPGVTREVLPQLRHEIFNEPEAPEVLARVLDWIDSHLGRADVSAGSD